MFRDPGAASISTYKMVKKFKFEDNLLLTDIPRGPLMHNMIKLRKH